jgi:cell division protein FtsW
LFLPFAHSDFIFAVIGEELGLIGALVVILMFAVFLWRGMRAALRAPDRFGMLLGIGIVVGIVAQALLNMSVVLALVPTKGIPLPFISYGGSSLLPTLIGVGILLNISQYAALGKRATFGEDDYEDEWQEGQRPKKRRAPRQRATAVARARYG